MRPFSFPAADGQMPEKPRNTALFQRLVFPARREYISAKPEMLSLPRLQKNVKGEIDMDRSRIVLLLCILLLSVCLVFAVTALMVLRNAVSETDRVRVQAQELLDSLSGELEQALQAGGTNAPAESVPADVLYDSLCIRESGGKIAVYTADGYLVRLFDVRVDTLPEADRAALREGISVSSWKELLSVIQDYTG